MNGSNLHNNHESDHSFGITNHESDHHFGFPNKSYDHHLGITNEETLNKELV
ncbi:MAG: hypothetical protein WCR81_07700 [Fermentimonas sp.]